MSAVRLQARYCLCLSCPQPNTDLSNCLSEKAETYPSLPVPRVLLLGPLDCSRPKQGCVREELRMNILF